MSTCCESGKARVYYNIPKKGGLKYSSEDGSRWNIVYAEEALTWSCEDTDYLQGGQCIDKTYKVFSKIYWSSDGSIYVEETPYTGKILGIRYMAENEYSGLPIYPGKFPRIGHCQERIVPLAFYIEITYQTSDGVIHTQLNRTNAGPSCLCDNDDTGSISFLRIERADGTSLADDIAQCGGENPTKRFKVIGEETGTVYVNVERNNCPKVQTIECAFSPSSQQYIDVELASLDVEVLRKVPGYGNNPILTKYRECVAVSVIQPGAIGNTTGKKVLQIRKEGQAGFLGTWINLMLFSVVAEIESPANCPDPTYSVECCPSAGCGEDKKCPPETTCEIVCNGSRCCYRNGKLIKEIPL